MAIPSIFGHFYIGDLQTLAHPTAYFNDLSGKKSVVKAEVRLVAKKNVLL